MPQSIFDSIFIAPLSFDLIVQLFFFIIVQILIFTIIQVSFAIVVLSNTVFAFRFIADV